jgi:hypothetical protein
VLKRVNPLVGDTKDFKEGYPKRRALAFLVASIRPCLTEKQCSGFDFIPMNAHKVLLYARVRMLAKLSINTDFCN